jgi:chaperonin GroEL
VISPDRGVTFENAELDVIGSARKVIVTKDETTIIEGAGPAAAVNARVKQIMAQVDPNKQMTDYANESLAKRYAALQGKVAVIKVGGATETEIEEKKFRVDDAVAAVKAALSEGIVPGGGVTLINLADSLEGTKGKGLLYELANLTNSELAGAQLLKNALEQPFRIIVSNAGLNPDEWLPQVRAAKPGHGLDINDPAKIVDLKAKGVVDPVRVTKEAVLSASSIAGTSMTMGALVVELPEEKSAAMPGAPDMGGMGMM